MMPTNLNTMVLLSLATLVARELQQGMEDEKFTVGELLETIQKAVAQMGLIDMVIYGKK
jgi:hypothetical protein